MDEGPGPRKFDGQPRTSGMAIASLVLGLLSFCLSVLAGLPAIILGALSLNAIGRSNGRLAGKGMAITGIVTGTLGLLILPALLLPAVQAAREAARRAQCSNNLKQIAIALMNYHDTHACFPPAFSPDGDGKPRCSWRVSILPYLEQVSVFNAYNFEVAWDHAANTTAINAHIGVYSCPSEGIKSGEEHLTNYVMVTGPGAFFDPRRAPITSIRDVTDGLGATIGVFQSSRKVHWAAPDDVVIDVSKPLDLSLFKNPHPGGFQAMFLDGSVRLIKQSTAPDTLRGLYSIAGGEAIPAGDLSF